MLYLRRHSAYAKLYTSLFLRPYFEGVLILYLRSPPRQCKTVVVDDFVLTGSPAIEGGGSFCTFGQWYGSVGRILEIRF